MSRRAWIHAVSSFWYTSRHSEAYLRFLAKAADIQWSAKICDYLFQIALKKHTTNMYVCVCTVLAKLVAMSTFSKMSCYFHNKISRNEHIFKDELLFSQSLLKRIPYHTLKFGTYQIKTYNIKKKLYHNCLININ